MSRNENNSLWIIKEELKGIYRDSTGRKGKNSSQNN